MNENQQEKTRYTAFDMFCGCGGLTVGLKRAGFRVLGAVDNDLLAVQTYKANHKEVEVWETDIRKLDPQKVLDKLRLKPGELDLLAGCPPCQGFSSMRTLNGSKTVKDDRNDLALEFLRFAKVMLPRSIMLENVPGLVDETSFKKMCKGLKGLGYQGQVRVLNTADYGVAQRRRRLIYIAGYRMDIPFGNKSGKRYTVKDAIGGLPKAGKSGDAVHDIPENRSARTREIIKLIPKNGGSRTDLSEEYQLECHKRCNGFKDVYGRMSWNKAAPTITSGCFNPSKGRFLHPSANRAITMREAALLQGLPRHYIFPETKSKTGLAVMIGNVLPPSFIAAHGRSIDRTLRSRDLALIEEAGEA